MKEQPEALRLADALDAWDGTLMMPAGWRQRASAELRRLHADAEESEALRERLSALLRNTAIALRGPEPELTRWSWHDLPELAAALKAQRDAIQQVVDEQAEDEGLWFRAQTAAEAYLQQELRRLHAAVEGEK